VDIIEFSKMAIQMIVSGNDIPIIPETKGYFERIIFIVQQNVVLRVENAELKAFRQMWKAFKSKRGNRSAFVLCSPSKGTIRDDMESFEQKYLKEAKSGKVKS